VAKIGVPQTCAKKNGGLRARRKPAPRKMTACELAAILREGK